MRSAHGAAARSDGSARTRRADTGRGRGGRCRSGGGCARRASTSSAISRSATHAPWLNLVTAAMTKTIADSAAPTRVEQHALAPVLLAPAPPVHDHPGLGQGEGDEHADGVEGDQRVGATAEHGEQERGGDGERDRAVAERQPVAEPQEQARRVPVASHERQQAREAVERGVGREQQHQRRGDLHVGVQRPGPEAAMSQLRERGLRRRAARCRRGASARRARRTSPPAGRPSA